MRWTWAILGIAVVTTAAAAPPEPLARYRIRWSDQQFPIARVNALLSSKDCTFGTSRKWSTFFEGDAGWSRFVHDISARDARGRTLAVTPLKEGRWKLGSASASCKARIQYSVDFSFGRQQWEAGNEQVAYVTDRGLFSTGLPLFIIGDPGPARVQVDAPTGWTFASPWPQLGPRTFLPSTQGALLENTLVVGRTYSESFAADHFDVTVALVGHPDYSAEQIRSTFRKIAPRLVKQFGDERPGRYMITLIRGPEDGESYEDSFAVSTAEPLSADNRIVWANHLAHELIHYWIGKAIAPPEGREDEYKWFTEGFTEYLANRTLLDAAVYSDSDYRQRMSRHFGIYLLTRQNPFFMETSLKQAGAKSWSNRPLIYSGGAVLAFCMDSWIRQKSGGRKDLSDAIRQLFQESRSGSMLSDAAIVRALSAAAGEDMSKAYAKYVDGKAAMPVAQCAADAGMRAFEQGYDVFLEPGARVSTK